MDAALSPLTGDAIVAASSGFPTARAFVYRADGAALAPGWGDVEVLDTGVPGFTPVSVATNGSVVAVGAGRAAGTGQVFVFVDGPGGFVLADVLLPPAGSGALGFGSALAVSGRRIVVGAPGTDTAGLDRAGALFVYEQSGGGWRFTERIDSVIPTERAEFGQTFALDGDLLAISDPGFGARVLRRTGAGWTPEFEVPGLAEGIEIHGGVLFRADFEFILDPYAVVRVVRVYSDSSGGGWELRQTVPFSLEPLSPLPNVLHADADRLVAGSGAASLGDRARPIQVYRRVAPDLLVEESNFDERDAALGAGLTSVVAVGSSVWVGSARGEVFGVDRPDVNGALARFELGLGGSFLCAGPRPLDVRSGCSTLLENDLELEASGLLPGQPAILLVGDGTGSVSIPGGLTVCVGGSVGRSGIVAVGPTGRATFPIDLGAVPAPSGPAPAVAGQNLGFQVFAREPALPSGAILTEGLLVRVR